MEVKKKRYIFDAQYFVEHQKTILWFSNTWFGRRILCINGKKSSVGKNKITKIEPHAITWDNHDGTFSTEFRTHDKFAKRLYFAFLPVWLTFHAWDMQIANPLRRLAKRLKREFEPVPVPIPLPNWNLGFDTTTYWPETGSGVGKIACDGFAERSGQDASLSSIRSGSGTGGWASNGTSHFSLVTSSNTSNQFYRMSRAIFNFNTSSLTSYANLFSGTVSAWGDATQRLANLGTNCSYCLVSNSSTAPNNVVAADYQTANSTELSGTRVSYNSYSDSAYNDFALNASGLANISKTGVSQFAARSSWDLDNSFGGVWAASVTTYVSYRTADYAGTSTDVKLVLTYSISRPKDSSAKADILRTDIAQINSAKANITTQNLSGANFAKASIVRSESYDQYAKAFSAGTTGTAAADNYAIADFLVTDNTVTNSAKAAIIHLMLNDNFAKADILHRNYEVENSAKASIFQFFSEKRYDYRIYWQGTYRTTWSSDVLSEPSFRMNINSGAGEMVIRLDREFDSFGEDWDVRLFNKVECWCFDREALNGVLVYSGYISGYKPVIDGPKEYIEVTVLPYVTEFNNYMLRTGAGDTTIAQNSMDPTTIFQNIITYYRADGGNVNYTASSVDMTNTTVSYTFKTYTVKEALDKAIELTPENWYWFVAPDNLLYLKESNLTSADHSFIIGKHIKSLETWRRGEDIINRVYFVGAETGGVNMYRVYSNTSSVEQYGIHATKVVDQRVSVTGTADIIANRYINEKKDPEIRTTIVILDSNGTNAQFGYNIESILPGQSMRIKNINQGIKTISYWDQLMWDEDVWDETLQYQSSDIIQIQSVEYHPNYVIIEASSRLPEVSKRVEDINRNLEETQANNTPTSPTAG